MGAPLRVNSLGESLRLQILYSYHETKEFQRIFPTLIINNCVLFKRE